MVDSLSGLAGYPLYHIAIDVKESPKSALPASRQFLGETGTRREVVTHTTNLPFKWSTNFTQLARSEIYTLLDFFNIVRGRRTPFWWIFEQKLFSAAANYIAIDTILAIEANLSALDYRGYERIFLLLQNGDLITRQVSAINQGLNEEDPYSLVITEQLGRVVNKEDIALFGKLLFCRLDSDDIKLSYQTATIANASLDFIELVEEYPE